MIDTFNLRSTKQTYSMILSTYYDKWWYRTERYTQDNAGSFKNVRKGNNVILITYFTVIIKHKLLYTCIHNGAIKKEGEHNRIKSPGAREDTLLPRWMHHHHIIIHEKRNKRWDEVHTQNNKHVGKAASKHVISSLSLSLWQSSCCFHKIYIT